MKVIQYSTNKYGENIPAPLKEALYMGGPAIAKVADGKKNSGFLGFGVAITGSSCYNLAKMESSERRALLEQIYG